MVLSKELRPVQSKKLYEEKSKEMLQNVSLGAGNKFSSLVDPSNAELCIFWGKTPKSNYIHLYLVISTY